MGDPFAKDVLAAIENPSAPDANTLILEALMAINDALARMADQTKVVTSPWIEMPPDGIPFDELGWTSLAAGDPLGKTYTVLQFQVPQGNNGVIIWKGNEYLGPEFVEGTGDVVWQIWADGQPITNYQKILGSLGSPSSPSQTAPLRIYESQTITLVLINVAIAAAGQGLGGRLAGWYYPIAYDEKKAIVEEAEDE
jgi:hypothetical protein